MRKLNPTSAALLAFLHNGPMTGWDIVSHAQGNIGDFWTLTRSQVYRELRALAVAGLIQPGETGPRDRQPYQLTDAGRSAFEDWLSEPMPAETVRVPILLITALGQQLPAGRLAEQIGQHRAAHAARLEHYRQVLDTFGEQMSVYSRATLDFGIRYDEMVVAWCDALPPEVRT